MHPQPRFEGTPTMSLRFGKSIGVALLLAAGLFVLVLALSSPSPSGVGAHPCVTPIPPPTEQHVDFQRTGVRCGLPTHQQESHEHTFEVDGGRDRYLEFKAYVPEGVDDIGSIEITFEPSFDLFDPNPSVDLITFDDSGDDEAINVTSAGAIGNKLTLTGDFTGILDNGEYLTIAIKAGAGIETPHTPWGPDTPRILENLENDKGYPVIIYFVEGGEPSIRKRATDKNFVVVRNPISSTVPSSTVQVELATYTNTTFTSNDEIVVDFSGPSADSGFILPNSMTASRIQVDYDYDPMKGEFTEDFIPSEVQIQGERVIFSVPTGKDDVRISFIGEYKITFKSLARIKNPFSAGIKTIKVSSFNSNEMDTLEAVVLRTTTVSPQEGPRGSEFTLEGKGYAAGTVTVYYDADGPGDIDLGETLASVKTVRGAFKTKLTAGGNPGEAQYTVRTRDSEGVEVSRGFNIRSAMSFEPNPVNLGSRLTIVISDWEEERREVVAVEIGGEPLILAKAIEYQNCIEHPDAARRDDEGNVTLTVDVPFDIPPGEQTVAVYDHDQLDYENEDRPGQPVIKKACHELSEGTQGQLIDELKQAIITDDPIAITKATVDIGSEQLEFSRSSAARGQRITITGSGFDRGTNGGNGIGSVLVNGIPVAEDPAQFEVTTSGAFAFTVTVPIGAVDGGNEVRVTGTESSLAQGTLDVPAASIELNPPESRRGERVRVTGSNFIASRSVRLHYGDGADLTNGDEAIGSALADATGSFTFTFNVPITAEIGETHKVTAVAEAVDEDGDEVSVRAEANHGPPSAVITTEPEAASPGDTLTIIGRNMPPFAQVRPIHLNGIDVTPGPNPGTDRNGAFEAKVIVPQMELGDQLLRVEVSGVVVTRVFSVISPSIGRPPTEVFATLIGAGTLGRVWKYDNSDQSWSLYDPDPVFDEFNTLSKLDSGDIVWINVLAPAFFQGNEMREGWNLIPVRIG